EGRRTCAHGGLRTHLPPPRPLSARSALHPIRRGTCRRGGRGASGEVERCSRLAPARTLERRSVLRPEALPVSRLFNAYVMVDWSAASAPKQGKDSIWIGVLKRDIRFRLAFDAFNPATRKAAEAQLREVLADLRRRGD